MNRLGIIVVVLCGLAPGCVIDANHVRTTLIEICAEDVPLLFLQESPELAVASVTVSDVGAEVDDPDARAELDTVTLEVRAGIADFSWVDSVRVQLIAPSSSLPDIAVAEDASVSGESPMVTEGDRSVNLVDYLVSDMLEIRIELAGDIPAASFNTLFSACVDVEGIEVADE